MSTDINRAKSNNCATDKQEDNNDEKSKKNSKEFNATTYLEMLPLYIFRSGHFIVLNHHLLSMKKVFLFWLINATTATASHHIVTAIIEKIMVIEVSKTVNL